MMAQNKQEDNYAGSFLNAPGACAAMNTRLLEILADSFPKILIPGLTVTIPLTAISFSLAMVIAVAMALVQFARVPVLTQLCRFYIWVFRGTPLLVQLFTVFFGMPKMGIRIDPFPAAVIVFSLNEGAYCAETVRAALESVPAGQLEAGYDLDADHEADHPAPGHAHGFPAPVQLPHCHGEGHLPCRKHHGGGDVSGCRADQRPGL
jgi:His/Glu/Gln/Arg/opine family amino acid ABC transporter permease subunit